MRATCLEQFDDVKELAFGLVEGAVKQEGVLVSAGWVGYMQAYLAHTAKAATQPKSRIFLKRYVNYGHERACVAVHSCLSRLHVLMPVLTSRVCYVCCTYQNATRIPRLG